MGRDTRLAWTLAIAAVLLYGLFRIALNPMRITADSALYVQAGDMIVNGSLPYVDVVDVNPPLIFYVHAVPAAIARALQTHQLLTFLLFVWSLTVLSIVTTRRALARFLEPDEPIHADLLALSMALFMLFLIARNDFGQREHLFVLGFMPYLVFRVRHWNGGTSGAIAAVAAGIGGGLATGLKPYFIPIALAPEAYWLIRTRSVRAFLRPDFAAFAMTGAAYAVHLLLPPEAMRASLYDTWLPLVVHGYRAYDLTLQAIVLYRGRFWLPPLALGLVFLLRPIGHSRGWRFTETLAVAGVASVGSYFAQHKGWSYHAIPAEAALFGVVGLFVAETSARSIIGTRPSMALTIPVRFIRAGLVAIVAALSGAIAVLATQSMVERRINDIIEASPLAQAIVEHTAPGDPVMFLATFADYPYPMLTALDRPQASRFLLTFPIPLLYAGDTGAPGRPFPYHGVGDVPMPAAERMFRRNLKDDIDAKRPKMIVVDAHPECQACPPGFSIHEYFVRTGFVDEAFSGYRAAGAIDHMMVYLRNDVARKH